MNKRQPKPKTAAGIKPPEKLVYGFQEVAKLVDVEPETLETWENEFPFLNAGRTGTGQRFFRQKDVDIIRRIKELLSEKALTLAGIKRRIEQEFGLAPADHVHPDKLRKALYTVRDELHQIAKTLDKGPRKK